MLPGGSRAPRALLALAVVLVLTTACAPSASAQQEEACRPPRLLVSEGPALWEPGGTHTFHVAVENENQPPVESVTARLDASAPAGWSVSLSQTSLILRPGDAPIVAVTVTAPQRGTGVADGDVALAVQFTCHRAGSVDTRASTTTQIPVELEAARIPWVLLVGGLGLIAAVSATLWAVRWRQGPVGIEAGVDEKPVVPGKSVQFPIRVVNRRRGPDTVRLTAHGTPEGWATHLAVPEIGLEGREERDLWVALRAPPDARFGDEIAVVIEAASARAGRAPVTVRLTARVRREE